MLGLRLLFLRLGRHLEELHFLIDHHREVGEGKILFTSLVPHSRRLQKLLLVVFSLNFFQEFSEDLRLQALLEEEGLNRGDLLELAEALLDGVGQVLEELPVIPQKVLDVVHLGQRLDRGKVRLVGVLDVELQGEAEGPSTFHDRIRVGLGIRHEEQFLDVGPGDTGGMLCQFGPELALRLVVIAQRLHLQRLASAKTSFCGMTASIFKPRILNINVPHLNNFIVLVIRVISQLFLRLHI